MNVSGTVACRYWPLTLRMYTSAWSCLLTAAMADQFVAKLQVASAACVDSSTAGMVSPLEDKHSHLEELVRRMHTV